MSQPCKPSICPGCNQIRLRRDFKTKPGPGNIPYPTCRICRESARLKKGATKKCITCEETKQITRDFVIVRDKQKKYVGYTPDCRQCREEHAVRNKHMSEVGKARWAVKKEKQEAAAAVPCNTTNPFDWKTYTQPWQPPAPERKNAAQ